ncbi:predicted protein [Methanosarcina acetivorans C2A]|uniref:Uncharacterized protein n=1 Tax=Methanosarcina acetivorans (strain ATCC 35395 / DSM 2834 / JCM 12185 / C2A) TaxID=188937 RepID=Q8TND3_METAC|nr:predicted protein [Methanosarcina acetivorans C2A]
MRSIHHREIPVDPCYHHLQVSVSFTGLHFYPTRRHFLWVLCFDVLFWFLVSCRILSAVGKKNVLMIFRRHTSIFASHRLVFLPKLHEVLFHFVTRIISFILHSPTSLRCPYIRTLFSFLHFLI